MCFSSYGSVVFCSFLCQISICFYTTCAHHQKVIKPAVLAWQRQLRTTEVWENCKHFSYFNLWNFSLFWISASSAKLKFSHQPHLKTKKFIEMEEKLRKVIRAWISTPCECEIWRVSGKGKKLFQSFLNSSLVSRWKKIETEKLSTF